MSKSWDEVVNSAAFSNFSPAQREQARQQYFNEVVAPQVNRHGFNRHLGVI